MPHAATGLSRLHDTTGVQTDKQLLHKTMYAAHQPLSELARQSAQIKDSPFEQVGVDFDAYCNAFQHAHIHLEDAVNTWLKPGHTNTQTDCPQANRGPPAMAGTRPLPPSPFSVTGATLAGCQQALTSAQPQYTLAQHPSDLSSMCLNLSPSSHTALSALPGKPKADPDLKQQQQQGGCRSLTEDARLNFRGGLQGQGDRVNWQCPQGQGHPGQAPVFNPTEATAFGRGWVPGQAPTPGCVGTVYQFQGSGGGGAGVQQGSCGGPTGVQQGSGRGPAEGQQGVSNRTQAGCTNTSQVRGLPFPVLSSFVSSLHPPPSSYPQHPLVDTYTDTL